MKTSTYLKASFALTGLALTTAFNASAQITLSQSDMPQIGSTYVYANDNTPTVTPGSAGANQMWDLSTIKNSQTDSLYALSPSSTPYSSSFPSANLAMRLDEAGSDVYEYANLGADSMLIVGTVAPDNGELAYGTLNPANIGMVFPATYNTQWSGSYINVTKVSTGAGDTTKEVLLMTYTDIIDGWGSVKTPVGSYNSLRVNSTFQTQYDSIYQYFGGMWIFISSVPTIQSQSYSWYATGMGSYVAQINLSGGNVESASYMSNAPTGVNELKNYVSVSVYPNPASSFVNIAIQTANQEGYVKVLDITGREIESAELANGKMQINTSSYANGMYLYLITDMSGNLLDKGKFTVTH